ncbi:MacB family efflux pump subunit [Bartonella apis]|uniref:MacB family efflux pump subunit n=1 Tax=Bartonella apis TaxID=1686310 RepID=UPI00242E52B5|nr:MacB family efflux pump subunit [Bartonella apis]MCT6824697.1 MacB family efflux pump subunit [Bartonella apis]MCT6861249.1 MacB family efflux pump subunit [Bartonella apis]MCT6886597.1 MacB family efflux pump subunit [Bartonella apis]
MENTHKDAVIVLKDVVREFPAGETSVRVLKGLNLTIYRGEMVAIVGASGSGKSTLMNILGCLDRPSSGSYKISGKETSQLSADELSALRRDHFGFIFQRYHLLGELTALDNVEIPAIYAGRSPHERERRATALLQRLGMGERITHRPGQLSGGQQQRVSIARALMNNGEVILADEPTGALDSHSGEEVLRILEEIHAEGRTIIIVTHDMSVAKKAERIIEISDGEILSDKPNRPTEVATGHADEVATEVVSNKKIVILRSFLDRFHEAFRMALLSMNAHRMRTFLTMLGVIIGIAAVVSMVALGNGTQKQILENINSLGSNTLNIFAGKSFADMRSGKVTTLVDSDATALSEQPYADAVTPSVTTSSTVRYGSIESNVTVYGVSDQYFKAQGAKLVEGRLFDSESVASRATDLVVEKQAVPTLFPDSHESPIGQVVLVGKVPTRIVGVIELQQMGPPSDTLQLYLPYTTVQTRFLGNKTVRSITLKVADNVDSRLAEAAVKRFLIMRHGTEDFFIRNSEEFREQVIASTQVLTLLVASIALISLLVGGIGVMNIMLVTVSERINEIGVRMAVGARQSDILQQFLIESVLVCLIGGALGILLGLSVGWIFAVSGAPFKLVYSTGSIIIAFVFSTLIGIGFGFLPARNASKLDPVAALSRD